MYIQGVGRVRIQDAMGILTEEGRQVVDDVDITLDELGQMYKLELVKKLSKIGRFPDTFRESYKWVPEELREQLSPEQLASLVDSFHECYGAGKNA